MDGGASPDDNFPVASFVAKELDRGAAVGTTTVVVLTSVAA